MAFAQTTQGHAAMRQARAGLLADRVLVAEAGVLHQVTQTVRALPGVAAATAVARTGVIAEYRELGDTMVQTYGAQGVTPDGLGQTMDLGVRGGSLVDLHEGTVAVSEYAAETIGARLGKRIRLRLGDGTPIPPRAWSRSTSAGSGSATSPSRMRPCGAPH